MIPARMGSSRFPGKPLAPLLGRTMIEHVYRRCELARRLDEVWIATCDDEIANAVRGFGGNVVMTADTHERASDRIAEAARTIEADLYVMIQGDEPMTVPDMIDAAVAPFLEDAAIQCVNLAKRIEREEDYRNPDTIKVVMDRAGNALYMSREPIPTTDKLAFSELGAFKQVCIIPFTRTSLKLYSELPPTPLEVAESIDMLRFMENGISVRMVETPFDTQAVDRPADLERVAELMKADPLLARYAG